MRKRPIIFGSDHAGKELETALLKDLQSSRGFGTWQISSLDMDGHYPQVAEAVCYRVIREDALGVLICGTGLGMCIAANKMPAIRAVSCHDTYSASMARAHNDANVICLGARVIALGLAQTIVSSFLLTPFEGDRHLERVNMIRELENRSFKP